MGDKKLRDSISDIVITSLCETDEMVEFSKASTPNCSFSNGLLATSAAPVFLDPQEVEGKKHRDGGVRRNNPGPIGHAYFKNRGIEEQNMFILSLGTGYFPRQHTFNPGIAGPVAQMADLTIGTEESDVELKKIFSLYPQNYVRCQPVLDRDIGLADSSDQNIQYLMDVAEAYIEDAYAADDNWFNGLIERLQSRDRIM